MTPDNSESALIAVPTRNRLDAVLTSLQSLNGLAARPEIRILVSDNSDVPSNELEKYCEGHCIEYTTPPETMSMADHWDWILKNNDYKAVTILTDRSYLLENVYLDALKFSLENEIAVTYESAFYSQKAVSVINFGVLFSKIRSGSKFFFACDQLLNMTESGQVCWALPRLLNSVIPGSHVRKMMVKYPKLLSSISPDFEFAYKYIYMFENIMFVDDIGMLRHSGSLSNGAAWNTGVENDASRDFARRSMGQGLSHSPLPNNLSAYSNIAHEFNKISSELNSERRITRDVLEKQLKLLDGKIKSRANKNLLSRLNTIAAILRLHPSNSINISINKNIGEVDCSKIRRDREKISFYELV